MLLSKQEATKKIADLIAEAQSLIWEAENIADEAGVSFSVNFGGYGMGGRYTGAAAVDEYDRSEYDLGEDDGFWRGSSQSC